MTEPNGFYYMRARYYDTEVGRFISEDPIGFAGGDVNLFAYVKNNPILLIDPLGLFTPGPTCMVCEGNVHPLQQMASNTNVYSNDVNLTGEQWAAYAGVGLGAPW